MSDNTGIWVPVSEAFEIADGSTIYSDPEAPVFVYKNAGDNPVPPEVWYDDYAPPAPYILNSTRNLQFNESMFLASPGAPLGTTTYITTPDGYTWATITNAKNAVWPFNAADYDGMTPPVTTPYQAGNWVLTPPEGVVKVTSNLKAQNIKFYAEDPETGEKLVRHFIVDGWGNRYIMHASNQDTPEEVQAAFDAAVLPEGWTKETVELEEELILTPAEGADGTYHYLVLRDSSDNSYHQVSWSGQGSLAAQIEGMPVWGGQLADTILSSSAWDDIVHGAGGDDRIGGLGGDDTLWGDAGADTVDGGAGQDVLRGDGGDDVLQGRAGRDVLLGGDGNDTLDGGAGADTLDGGLGNDVYLVRHPGDLVIEWGGGGLDELRSRISVVLPANVESLVLLGEAPLSGTGNRGANAITGNAGDNLLVGAGGADTIGGGAGGDTLAGGAGRDVLEGGEGEDAFLFASVAGPSHLDRVLDFLPGSDRILLSASVFTALEPGALPDGAFALGRRAEEADDRILYDTVSGALAYDPDGVGGLRAKVFAVLDAAPALSASDIIVVA